MPAEAKGSKTIDAIFEDGVIKPLEAVNLQEHQRLRVSISPHPGAVADFRGMITASPESVAEVAESDEFLPF